jgi:2-dehydro-3-deoxy-D-arabinonate dehydratase
MPEELLRIMRVEHDGEPRACRLSGETLEILDHDDPLAALAGGGRVVAWRLLAEARVLAPIAAPEIWCAGVTYERSRDARLDESRHEARDVYSLVYNAARPELFLKDAGMRRSVGPDAPIGLRSDSRWMVPEPELAVVLGEGGELVAATIGNDVSSRDIEGDNPLYLPQAKIFASSCAIGPALVVPRDWDEPFTIRMRVYEDGIERYSGETTTASMRRSPRELAGWAVRDNPIPAGSVLLTGTGLVPPDDFTLEPGHVVEIEVDGIGVLRNPVGITSG